jgi:hypothetical protein
MTRSVGRNDPCPCGSGQKYKHCCLARDRAEQAERVAWERAAQNMRAALIGFAKDKAFVKDLALGLGMFWQDRYTLDSVQAMSVDESLRFYDWFAHDYALQAQEDAPRTGKRLVEVYRAEMAEALSDKEAATLELWIDSLPGSAFVLEGADAGEGTVVLRDLFLGGRTVTAHDGAAAAHGEVGQILLARPLPEHGRTRLSGATVVLPAAEEAELCAFMAEARASYLDAHPEAAEAQFMRERAHLLTHYALAWADREGRPAVAADDPDARGRGEKAMSRLVKWRQERIQVR